MLREKPQGKERGEEALWEGPGPKVSLPTHSGRILVHSQTVPPTLEQVWKYMSL